MCYATQNIIIWWHLFCPVAQPQFFIFIFCSNYLLYFPAKATCGSDMFRCFDGHCIKAKHRCDNEYDCTDHSDELNCHQWCDPAREFKCGNDSFCLSRVYVCDGHPNCKDGSDEKGCGKTDPVQLINFTKILTITWLK